MTVRLLAEPFRPWAVLAEHEAAGSGEGAPVGATAAFVGTMRDFNEGAPVEGLYLEHYPGMTERTLEAICSEAAAEHGLEDVLVVHRVGQVTPGEAIVLVATWSSHRKAAFEACRAIMEYLKQRAPFWKKEQRPDGAHWVTENTPGY